MLAHRRRFALQLSVLALALSAACSDTSTAPRRQPAWQPKSGSLDVLLDSNGHYILPDSMTTATALALVQPTRSPALGKFAPAHALANLTVFSAVNLVANPSFEVSAVNGSTSFPSWTTFNAGSGAWYLQSGTSIPASNGGYAVPGPTDGSFAVMSEQQGPGEHILYQDVTIPAGGATLMLDLFIGNRAAAFYSPATLSYTVSPNQQFRIDVMNPAASLTDVGAGVLANLYQTQPGDPLVMGGYTAKTFSLAAFGGQTVRLRFAEVDNQLYFNVGVDNVRVTANNQAPVANAGGPYSGSEGSAVALAWSASDPDGDALTYSWDFGDGSTGTGTTLPTGHTYADNGTYSVSVTANDGNGGSDTKTTSAVIANVAPTLGALSGPSAPVGVGAIANISGSFTDPGTLDTHTASVSWGDGNSSSGSIGGTNTNGTVSASHTYSAAGVYTVTISVTDKDGDASNASVFQYVVVYDPTAGFVTGGGWIDSPLGAYTADRTLTGKATFGFVSRYQKGQTVPTGNTQFQFKAGGLTFASTSYDWLVVAGARAQFKGQGTINGGGIYGFLITAIDGDIAGGGGVDRFRIKIWDIATGQVVYDNQLGAADGTTDPPTALGGGSIQIHQ